MSKKIIIALALFVFVYLVYSASKMFEYYDESLNFGWSNEARVNDFLAAEKFIEKRDVTVHSLVRLPARSKLFDSDVMLVPNANLIQLESQEALLLEWVSQGGTLILGAGHGDAPAIIGELGFTRVGKVGREFLNEEDLPEENKDTEEKSLADQMREENERIKLEQEKEQEKGAKDQEDEGTIPCAIEEYFCGVPAQPEIGDSSLSSISLDSDVPAKVDLSYSDYLQHAAIQGGVAESYVELQNTTAQVVEWFGDATGTTYAEVIYGSGTIHIFTDLEFLTNRSLAHFDHAFLLSKLAANARSFIILYGKEMPSLAVLVYRHFFEAMIALAVLLLCGILHFGKRLGLVQDLPFVARRSRAERYSAVARFRWQTKDDESLLSSARQEVLKKSARRWPLFKNWKASKQVEVLAEYSGITESAVNAALFESQDFSEHSFTNIIKVLQALRNRV